MEDRPCIWPLKARQVRYICDKIRQGSVLLTQALQNICVPGGDSNAVRRIPILKSSMSCSAVGDHRCAVCCSRSLCIGAGNRTCHGAGRIGHARQPDPGRGCEHHPRAGCAAYRPGRRPGTAHPHARSGRYRRLWRRLHRGTAPGAWAAGEFFARTRRQWRVWWRRRTGHPRQRRAHLVFPRIAQLSARSDRTDRGVHRGSCPEIRLFARSTGGEFHPERQFLQPRDRGGIRPAFRWRLFHAGGGRHLPADRRSQQAEPQSGMGKFQPADRSGTRHRADRWQHSRCRDRSRSSTVSQPCGRHCRD